MEKKIINFEGTNNYIDLRTQEAELPAELRIRIVKRPLLSFKGKTLYWEDLIPFIKDTEYHHISWDGKDVQIDGKFYKL